MFLKFDKNLTTEEIYANGSELARFMGQDTDSNGKRVHTWPNDKKKFVVSLKNPVLVWDDYVTGHIEEITGIENSTLRNNLNKLFALPYRRTEYDGVSVESDEAKYWGVWGPSIDTLVLCKALNLVDMQNKKQVIEVGYGSGFISKYILQKNKGVKKVDMIDISEFAEKCARYNITDPRADIKQGDGIRFLETSDKKYDLIVCNPPYIPRPKSVEDNPYEGVGLLANLVKMVPTRLNQGGSLITNYSSVGSDLFEQFIAENNVSAKVLESKEVPFKVLNTLNEPEWMDYLLNRAVTHKGAGLVKNRKNGHDYWHTINIVEVKAK